jgi:hypothetical protein
MMMMMMMVLMMMMMMMMTHQWWPQTSHLTSHLTLPLPLMLVLALTLALALTLLALTLTLMRIWMQRHRVVIHRPHPRAALANNRCCLIRTHRTFWKAIHPR